MQQILVYGDSLTWGIIVDGVHLDADQHAILGRSLAKFVSALLARTT